MNRARLTWPAAALARFSHFLIMRPGRHGKRKAQLFEPPAGPRRVLDEKFNTEVIRLVQKAIEKKKSAKALQEQEDE